MDKRRIEIEVYKEEEQIDGRVMKEVYWCSNGRDYVDEGILAMICSFMCKSWDLVVKVLGQKICNGFKEIESFCVGEFQNKTMFKKIIDKPFTKQISTCIMLFDLNELPKRTTLPKGVYNYLPLITTNFSLCNTNLSATQLRKIIQIGRHIKNISFICCKITPTPFKLTKSITYSINSLQITLRLKPEIALWSIHPEKVQNLLRAISLTNMKSTLQTFKLDLPDFDEEFREIADELGMNDLQFEFEK
ncbi:unnamed protein product [Moneuplotes crassus]|uniref:Uncharacterized protein n=1 Tax=Euplotes crassus TaxID=5936 RepID=A0AAD1XW28_EUPCR|nr:unnamed protein product [Moneuplotes crassus]